MTTIKMRRGTSAEWRAANPVPADGEICVERDTKRFRIGNASNSYLGLDAFVALPEITAAIEHERVTTATSWSALPASGNWVGRTIHIPSVKAFAYWDGIRWCIDPRSDTGWVPVTTWDSAGVVSGVPINDQILEPITGRAVGGGISVRRHGTFVSLYLSGVKYIGESNANATRIFPEGFSLPTGFTVDAGDYSTGLLYHYGAAYLYLSWVASSTFPMISGTKDAMCYRSTVTFLGDPLRFPTSLTINYTPPAP